MKTKLRYALLFSIITFISFAQSAEKIKGDRNVTTKTTEIEPFNRLVIEDDFEINIKQGELPSVQVDVDDNLHSVIAFSVNEGSLSFKTNKRITSKKTMVITVTFKDSLNIIELKQNAELTGVSTLKVQDFTLKTKESAKAYLTIEANDFKYIAAGKSKSELNITAKTSSIEMNDSSDLKALFETENIDVNMLQRADAKIEGETKNLNITLDNSPVLKAEKLTASNCTIISEGKSNAHLEANKLTIEATGTTHTYIYGTAKIDLKKFEDQAVLRKK